jgi:hypothetical protein
MTKRLHILLSAEEGALLAALAIAAEEGAFEALEGAWEKGSTTGAMTRAASNELSEALRELEDFYMR